MVLLTLIFCWIILKTHLMLLVYKEWWEFRAFANIQYVKYFDQVRLLWKKVFQYRRREFPNLFLLIELIMGISGSNSSVERCFNIRTQMLSDTPLSLDHSTVNNQMLIKCNDKIWSEAQREEIIKRATEIYISVEKASGTS